MHMLRNTPVSSRLFTSEESREIDQTTIRQFGPGGITLMEIAASGAARVIFEEQQHSKTGLFFCGKGNNAGDALAAARYLADQYHHKIKIIFALGTNGFSAETRLNYEILKKLSANNPRIEFHEKWDDSRQTISDADYIVDGIFGTGLKENVRAPVSALIDQINSWGKTIYSMDIPSGLNGTTGLPQGTSVQAGRTITFGTNKIGFYLNGSSQYTGSIHLVPLPYPRELMQSPVSLIDKELFNSTPAWTRDAKHKYDGGVVHLLAGSEGLTGAAIITAKSAVKHGAGAVFLYAPKKLLPVYEITLPEVIKIPLGDDSDTFYRKSHQNTILENLNNKPGILLAGPGTGTRPETISCLSAILEQHTRAAVIDADALKIFANSKFKGSDFSHLWLLTPHPGEAKKYLGISARDDHLKMSAVSRLTKRLKTNILLKGNPVLFTDFEDNKMITGYDTSMFNRTGFGDYLAGAVSAQYSIRHSLSDAVVSVLYGSFIEYKRLNSPMNFNPLQLIEG